MGAVKGVGTRRAVQVSPGKRKGMEITLAYPKIKNIPLFAGIIYGPVRSRRLGASLGVNLLPFNYKNCPFNCVYCHFGKTDYIGWGFSPEQPEDLPAIEEVVAEANRLFPVYREVKYITLSGNGEPTLHPDFLEIVEALQEVKRQYLPQAKLGVLSCSATVNNPRVCLGLSRLDLRMMKLDAGDERTFARIDRPYKGISFKEIVEGLKTLDDVIIQTLFLAGRFGNSALEQVEAWIEKIAEIKPVEVQIYTSDRPAAHKDVTKVSKEQLNEIAKKTQEQTGIKTKVY